LTGIPGMILNDIIVILFFINPIQCTQGNRFPGMRMNIIILTLKSNVSAL
jgi:hypothetical protein